MNMNINKITCTLFLIFFTLGCSKQGNDIKSTIELHVDGNLDQVEAEMIVEAYNIYLSSVGKIKLSAPEFKVCIKHLSDEGMVPSLFADKNSGFSDGFVMQDTDGKTVIFRDGCTVK
jgi:hypothetical protein